ncbi:MAG: hypothetical protein WC094_01635 [Candidatus Cloacimonas sp.]
MKKYLFLVLIILPVFLLGQVSSEETNIPGDSMPEEESEYPEGTQWGMGGAVGTVTIDNRTYSQIRLQPELQIGKFGIGLDIDLIIDAEGNVRKEDWDELQDYVNKFLYIRFAQRNDPFYFKIGSIPSYTLGNGLIFNNYSNMILYPSVKNVGGYIGVNTNISGLGFEAYSHNIRKNEILAGRVHIQPLAATNIPLLEKLRLGVNAGIDRDQNAKYEDKDGDHIPDIYDKFPKDKMRYLDTDNDGIADEDDIDIDGDGILDHPDYNPYIAQNFPGIEDIAQGYNLDIVIFPDTAAAYNKKDEILIYSADYQLPLIETDHFNLVNYGELAKIDGYGTGMIFPGFSSKFFIFDAKVEFRNFGDQFIPGYFDKQYDQQRAEVKYIVLEESGSQYWFLTTKESNLENVEASLGWFGYLRANLFDFIYPKIAYQDMYGKNNFLGKSLWGSITINPYMIPKLKEATIYYSQTNTNYINFRYLRNENAYISGRLVYSLSDNANLIGKYSEFYTDINCDGKIKGNDEVIESFTFGVEFQF